MFFGRYRLSKKEKLYKLYINNELIGSYGTGEKAVRTLDKWVIDNDMEGFVNDNMEYVYYGVVTCSIVKNVKPRRNKDVK